MSTAHASHPTTRILQAGPSRGLSGGTSVHPSGGPRCCKSLWWTKFKKVNPDAGRVEIFDHIPGTERLPESWPGLPVRGGQPEPPLEWAASQNVYHLLSHLLRTWEFKKCCKCWNHRSVCRQICKFGHRLQRMGEQIVIFCLVNRLVRNKVQVVGQGWPDVWPQSKAWNHSAWPQFRRKMTFDVSHYLEKEVTW